MKKSLVFIAFCLFASNLFAQEAKVVYSDFECIATCDNYNHTRTTIIPKDGWSDDVTLTCDGVERSFIVKVYGGAKKVLETFINRTVSKDEYKRSLFGYFSLDALKTGLISIHNDESEQITCGPKGEFDQVVNSIK
ncbi:MAG: hypothetical protein WCQ47_07425 [bacterium]